MDVNHYLINGWKFLLMEKKYLNVILKKFWKIYKLIIIRHHHRKCYKSPILLIILRILEIL